MIKMKKMKERNLGSHTWTPKIQYVRPRAGATAQRGWGICSRTLSRDTKLTLFPSPRSLNPNHTGLPAVPWLYYSLVCLRAFALAVLPQLVCSSSTFTRVAPFYTHVPPQKPRSERPPGLSRSNHFRAHHKPILIFCIAFITQVCFWILEFYFIYLLLYSRSLLRYILI